MMASIALIHQIQIEIFTRSHKFKVLKAKILKFSCKDYGILIQLLEGNPVIVCYM